MLIFPTSSLQIRRKSAELLPQEKKRGREGNSSWVRRAPATLHPSQPIAPHHFPHQGTKPQGDDKAGQEVIGRASRGRHAWHKQDRPSGLILQKVINQSSQLDIPDHVLTRLTYSQQQAVSRQFWQSKQLWWEIIRLILQDYWRLKLPALLDK